MFSEFLVVMLYDTVFFLVTSQNVKTYNEKSLNVE